VDARAVFSLKYHFVWCPRYRRPVLAGQVETRLKQLVMEIAEDRDIKIHALR
jgi:putative transposase